jgi:ankyrin repeat protein
MDSFLQRLRGLFFPSYKVHSLSQQLHEAVQANDLMKAKTLIDSNPSLTSVADLDERIPLHYAVEAGNINLVKVLNPSREDSEWFSKLDETPFHMAAASGHADIIKLFLDTPYFRPQRENKNRKAYVAGLHIRLPLLACRELSTASNIVYDGGIQLKAITPLHAAAYFGHISVVELLLEDGASIYAEANCNFTPLHLAALRGHAEVVKLLLRQLWPGDNYLNAPESWYGSTAMHLATVNQHVEVVKLLLSNRNVDVKVKDKRGRVPLDYAVFLESIPLRDLLKEAGKRG